MTSSDPKPLSQQDLMAIFDSDHVLAEEKYLNLWQQLQRFFEWKRVLDPSDLVQETIARGINNLQSGKKITIENPAGYFFGIARNIVKERWKVQPPEPLEEEELRPQSVLFLGLDRAEQNIYLEECLRELSQEDFDLLLAYTEGSTAEWAMAKGLRPGTVRLRIHRLRKRIEERVQARIRRAAKKI